jgi:DNA-binding SARP family transcriptional activator/basic membrane lipoprotein Med (substrate-binding protein (PBP1-ABC) superfamily)
VTNRESVIEFLVLGPLEVRLDGESLPLGGAKQRAVLAALLLRADEVVPIERLIDEVWGDDPPPSAAHSLESYVSRLRQLLNGHGPTLVRRGAGYSLELHDGTLDARTFLDLQQEAAAAEEPSRALELATAALAVWRGPALADVALASAGRAEAERFEELRLRAYEVRFDADLALGLHGQLIGEVQPLLAQNPYRERFVAQFMLALYRSGRHADALDVYERTRAALSEGLGLQPSLELQRLSGQIVRQDPELRRPAAALAPSEPQPIRRRARGLSRLVAVGASVAATMTFAASGSAPRAPEAKAVASAAVAPMTMRVALVLPRGPETVTVDDPRMNGTLAGFETASLYDYDTKIFVSPEIDPSPADVDRVSRRIEQGRFAFVLVLGGGDTARALRGVVRRLPETRFAFLDATLGSLGLEGVANATGVPFAEEESTELVGYLSGLSSPFGGSRRDRADIISVVAGEPSPRTRKVIAGFTRGVRAARPAIRVRVDYSHELLDRTACEHLANRQIDAGSDVVFALAGRCGVGALATARIRGVWGIHAEDDRAPDGDHILATTYKDWEAATISLVNAFAIEKLRGGRDVVLGLADDYAVGVSNNEKATSRLWSKVVLRCSKIRRHTVDDDI